MRIRNNAIGQFKGLLIISFLQIMALAFHSFHLLFTLILNYTPDLKQIIFFHFIRAVIDYTILTLITLLGIFIYKYLEKFKILRIRIIFVFWGVIFGFLLLFTILWLFFRLGTFFQAYTFSFVLGVALLRLKKWAIIPSVLLCPIILGESLALLYVTAIVALPSQLIKCFPAPLLYYGYIKMVIISFFYVIYINYFMNRGLLETFQCKFNKIFGEIALSKFINSLMSSRTKGLIFGSIAFLILIFGWFKSNPVNDGVRKAYYDNGNLEYEISYRQGKRHGKALEFFPNGQLKLEWIYQDGKLDGTSKEYYESGELYREHEYSNNTRIGLKVFYKNGRVKAEYQFKDGNQHGLARQYYENGMFESEGNFVQNNCSDCREYYETGELKQTLNYKDQKEDGPFKEYYKNGKLKAEGRYQNGERIDIKQYNENGVESPH